MIGSEKAHFVFFSSNLSSNVRQSRSRLERLHSLISLRFFRINQNRIRERRISTLAYTPTAAVVSTCCIFHLSPGALPVPCQEVGKVSGWLSGFEDGRQLLSPGSPPPAEAVEANQRSPHSDRFLSIFFFAFTSMANCRPAFTVVAVLCH